MPHFKKILISVLLCISIITSAILFQPIPAKAGESLSFIILSQYKSTLNIGEEAYLLALTSNGKKPSWKSSNSTIASVNTYGIVTAKKAGSAVITAKIKDAEANCYITVKNTVITISAVSASIERGETFKLSATTSNHSPVTWKSRRSSIATVDKYGTVTGLKPGNTIITAKANGTNVECNCTVKAPTVKLNRSTASLYRGQKVKLSATVSSNITPTWKTNKKSVAIVDASGTITAIKNGTATITATVDGVKATCDITVMKPEITLSKETITLKNGASAEIKATVSSGNTPVWSTSNSNVVTISSNGKITAKRKGKAYIYAAEDGTKVKCTVQVTE